MTVAIYRKSNDGNLRVGTFTVRRGGSIRAVSHAFIKRFPNADPNNLLIAKRLKLFGKWVDGEMLPFDLS